MRSIILLLFFLTTGLLFSQNNFEITGKISNLREKKVYLGSFYGEKVTVVDSAQVGPEGTFTFAVHPAQAHGYHRVILARDHYVDMIVNNENIRFSTDFDHPLDSLGFTESLENLIYYDFLKEIRENRLKEDLLSTLVDFYPKDDVFYREIAMQYEKVQRDMQRYTDSIAATYPHFYVTRVIRAQQRPFMGAELTPEERIDLLKSNYWSGIDMSDTSLLRSTVYTNLAIDYLSLHSNRQFTQEQLENAFIGAVDMILSHSMEDENVYRFMLEYLVKGFEKYHFDKVLDHISTTYSFEEGCENENIDSEVVKRLKNYQNLSVGKPAPGMILPDISGKMVDLRQFSNDYVLLIFWASWCPHCSEMMPRLKEIYHQYRPRLEMIAISIDSDEAAYRKALEEGNFPWLNCSDLKGWGTQPAIDYNIYATPTMFLLDKQKTIIAKPITLAELQTELRAVLQ